MELGHSQAAGGVMGKSIGGLTFGIPLRKEAIVLLSVKAGPRLDNQAHKNVALDRRKSLTVDNTVNNR